MLSSSELALIVELEELERAARTNYARRLAVIAEMERLDTAKHAGYTRLPVLVAEVLHITRSKASRMVTHAQQITEVTTPTGHVSPAPLPALREAVVAGQVEAEHLDVVTKVVQALPTWVSVADRELVETTLVDTAKVADPKLVADHGKILLDRFEADGKEPHAEERLAQPVNSFTYRRTTGGGMDFKGHVEQEIAEIFENLIHGFGAPVADDPRPRKQRLGDAVADVIDAASNAVKLPTTAGEKPHLAVYMDMNVLTDAVGTATLEGGSPLGASATRRLACDAEIIPIVLNGNSVPLDLGRAYRTVQHHQRKALVARDKGCAYPNCAAPASWCDAHHIKHWLHGGPTDLHNLVLLCRKHHRILHHSQWVVRIDPSTGVPEFIPPKWIDLAQRPLRNTLRL